MPPVHRPRPDGKVTIDVRLIEEIETVTMIDCEPPPDVVAPLAARIDALRDAWRNPYLDDELQADIRKAIDPYGGILDVEEIHVVQRLRGWHRNRHGTVVADAYWLTAARNLLDTLTLSLSEECADEIRQMNHPGERELHAASVKLMITQGMCGECMWCRALILRGECDAILDAAGYYGGPYYEAYAA